MWWVITKWEVGKRLSVHHQRTLFSPHSVNNTKLFSNVVVDTFCKLKRKWRKKKKKKGMNISGCNHQMGIFQFNTASSMSWLATEHFCVTSSVKTPLLQGENPSQEERRPSNLQPLPILTGWEHFHMFWEHLLREIQFKRLWTLLSIPLIPQVESNMHNKALVMGFPS